MKGPLIEEIGIIALSMTGDRKAEAVAGLVTMISPVMVIVIPYFGTMNRRKAHTAAVGLSDIVHTNQRDIAMDKTGVRPLDIMTFWRSKQVITTVIAKATLGKLPIK